MCERTVVLVANLYKPKKKKKGSMAFGPIKCITMRKISEKTRKRIKIA